MLALLRGLVECSYWKRGRAGLAERGEGGLIKRVSL